MQANSAVCKADDSGAMCLSASSSCKDLFGTHSIGMHGKIRSWKSVSNLFFSCLLFPALKFVLACMSWWDKFS